MRFVLGGVLHGNEAVHDFPEPWETVEGNLHGDAAFGGDDSDLYVGGAKTGEGRFDAWEFRDQGVVVLLVVEAIGLEEHPRLFGVDQLHLAWKRLADMGEQGLTGDVAAPQDLAGGVAEGLVDQLRGVDARAVEVEQGG